MDLSKSLEEISKFFNEILGYLLPGITLIILIDFFLDPNQVNEKLVISDTNILMLLFLSYVCGYVVYGLSLVLNNLKSKIKFVKNDEALIKVKISKQEDYRMTCEVLQKLIPGLDINKLKFNDIRNFAMAYVPEIDQKIYTFMFRSDLFKHTRDIFLIVSFWGLISYLTETFFNNTLLFNTNGINVYLLIILVVLIFPLNEGKKRFLTIAYKIQFNIFLAKAHPITHEHN
jgi:hypothetical protein